MTLSRSLFCIAALLPLSVWAQEPSSEPALEPASLNAPLAICGNGAKDAGEECDDGNTVDGDGCSASCTAASKEKSAAAAFGISLGASAASLGLVIAGTAVENENLSVALAMTGSGLLIVAPSAGHFYTGETRHALIFSGVRLGTVGLFTTGFLVGLGGVFRELSGAEKTVVALGLLGGSLGTVGLMVYDFIDAPRSAKRINTQATLLPKKAAPSLLPAAVALPGGGVAPGLTLKLRF